MKKDRCLCQQKKKQVHIFNSISTSASLEIAKKFANENSSFQLFKQKTILQFNNPQKLNHLVDVSWISPFVGEQELIVYGAGTAILSPKNCEIGIEGCFENYFVKTVIIDVDRMEYEGFYEKDVYLSILKKNVSDFWNYLKIISGESRFLSNFDFISAVSGLSEVVDNLFNGE